MSKRVTIMLNISLGLMAAYYSLFFIGYFAQKPLLWRLLGGEYYMSEEFKPVFSPVIIGMALAIAAGYAAFNLLLRRNASAGLRIGAEVFAFAAFTVNSLVKGIAPMIKTVIMGIFGGADDVVIGSLHSQSMGFLDMLLCPFFAVSLTLMVCACCIMQCERRLLTHA